jgi:hypothetical protein
MTPELATKVALLLRVPTFMADVEKTAADLGLNEAQKSDVVLRTANTLNLNNIEKMAAGWGSLLKNNWGKLLGIGGGTSALTAGGTLLGDRYLLDPKAQGYEAGKAFGEQNPANSDVLGMGLGSLGGAGLGAIAGNELSNGGTLGTGVGAGLGGVAGGVTGQYIQEMLRNHPLHV